jgi:hypothetical protein
MFREPLPEKTFPGTAVGIAVAAVVILAAVVFMLARRPAEPVANAAYAPNLSISDLQMSESDSQTGGKLIYIDGHVTNKGPATVTGIRVQVSFGNDQAMPAQVETVPMNMIYMREPYVDTRPVGASPLKPGGQADFRLIFDDVNDKWNQQLPQLQMTQIVTK